MKKIILDTNFVFLPFTLKIDIFSEIDRIMHEPYNLFVMEDTIDELDRIMQEQKGRDRETAKMALQLLEKKGVGKQKSLYMTGNSKKPIVDDIILALADKNHIVATQDRELRKKLTEKGIRTIYARKKSLEIKDVL
ncbi:TPA: hypothetical protein HA239_01705 [Candidatus Woesearchaeota archaeon]|nr:hypothetical protein QT06_C0001G0942 [archaeon GW2011_AR15]MBS3104582.1 hypothetical protein [Candidatus Woesearchaeota archaeon]HIH41103.1 hypothetical protein [Candidatus Woesearchaeota archaeon]